MTRPLDPRWPFLAAITLGALYLGRSALPPFIFAIIIAYVFSPLVGVIQSRLRLKRGIAVALFYLITLGPLTGAIVVIEPTLAREAAQFVRSAPDILRSVLNQTVGSGEISLFGLRATSESLMEAIQKGVVESIGGAEGAVRVAEKLIDTLLHVLLVVILVFYFLVDGQRFYRFFLRFWPPEHRSAVHGAMDNIHVVLGRYLRGQLLLIAIMSTLTYLGLAYLFHLPFALAIGILSGFLEVIPIVGPISAGAIAASVGLFALDPTSAIWIAVFYFVLRQLEDQLVMPVVVGQAVELHPIVTIFAVVLGGAIAGLIGLLLAVPTAAAIKVVLDRWPAFSGPDALVATPSSE